MNDTIFASVNGTDSRISILNRSETVTEIDIEGIIGLPEQEQFCHPKAKVATYEKFREMLDAIRGIASRRIVINIRSTGGNVNDALLIHDAVAASGAEVTTRCFGYVASAATIIAQAASPGRREISANALYLIHKSHSAAEGNADEMNRTAALLGKTDERIASIYATRSGRPKTLFVGLMNENNGNGRWLSASEAMEAGLVDRITGSAPVANDAADMIARLGLPEPNQNNMNVKNRWKAIAQRLGLGPAIAGGQHETEKETPPQATDAGREAPEQAAGNGTMPENRDDAVQAAADRAEEARAQALPTTTKPREDPDTTEHRQPANAQAYAEDIKHFK
ncbi:MAG: Clp protease ClpP [Rikenellaceae bacterium]|nr:Clp protease ClpP [Rikenellaceae bacterium]